jgi:hypothetical protein
LIGILSEAAFEIDLADDGVCFAAGIWGRLQSDRKDAA